MKDDFLWTAWHEDRTEIRLTRDRIFSICTFITAASFAVTAFLLGKEATLLKIWSPLLWVADISFVSFLWLIFLLLKKDLSNARKCLELRENLIRNQLLTGSACTDPFLPAFSAKPGIKENSLYLVAILATLAILIKSTVVHLLLFTAFA